jgi:hypothetical protein
MAKSHVESLDTRSQDAGITALQMKKTMIRIALDVVSKGAGHPINPPEIPREIDELALTVAVDYDVTISQNRSITPGKCTSTSTRFDLGRISLLQAVIAHYAPELQDSNLLAMRAAFNDAVKKELPQPTQASGR